MDGVSQTTLLHLRFALLSSKDPLREYMIACRQEIHDLQAAALDKCARVDIDFTQLHEMQGEYMARLTTARMDRIENICVVLCAYDIPSPFHHLMCGDCNCCQLPLSQQARSLWEDFVKTIVISSLRRPSIEDVLSDLEDRSVYEDLVATTCPGNKHPFSQIKKQLTDAVKDRED